MDLQSTDPMIVCGFRFEFVFYTNKSLLACYEMMNTVVINHQGVPEGVVIKKYITPQQYIDHLISVVAEAKAKNMTAGYTSGKLTRLQMEWLTKILNAAGYCSTKWIGYTRESTSAATIQQREDGEHTDDIIDEIEKRMYTRKAARNDKLLCCITNEGHCTKGYSSRRQLANHIYEKYGEMWDTNIKIVNNDGEMAPQRKKARPSIAPDMEGIYHDIGVFYVNNIRYTMFDAPRDGSCFYHSFSCILKPLLGTQCPSAGVIKETLREFYRDNDTQQKRSLENLLSCTFQERLQDIEDPGHWGQFDDALCLATIFKVKCSIIQVGSSRRPKTMHEEVVTGRKRNGHRYNNGESFIDANDLLLLPVHDGELSNVGHGSSDSVWICSRCKKSLKEKLPPFTSVNNMCVPSCFFRT